MTRIALAFYKHKAISALRLNLSFRAQICIFFYVKFRFPI
ncbi:hypothetical protein CSUNSWCD_1932 [Campylobacter showae CSUNSWCD]|uniref:Uncharacterized protein n=1 Tax=Campylobacter showae CSUNSWCD TaxID=1244083 RepID=M5IQL4_9BACT|nr:hypothetical protein CSUNSWCD_1932 [Campylobacter showae CSUNSWCD]